MKRKFWGYLSLAILLSQPVLAPLAQVMAEEQETIPSNKEITTLGTLEKVEETTETVDSSHIEEINGDTTSNSESQEVVNDDEKSGSTESTEKTLPDPSEDTASSATESSAEMKEASNRSVSLDAWMPDKNLQNEVAKGLNKTVDTITQEDMVNLKQLDFSSLAKDTVVDFTGLEYASNLQALYTTSIIATNVPKITMAENATLFTRPNVLAHILPKGSFSNIHIGNYDAYLTAQELIGVGQYLSGWVTDYLTVYASSMTDFSKLELSPEHHQNSQLSIMTQEKILLEPMLVKDGQSDVLYKDRMMVDTQGNALLSSLSNKKYSYSIRGIDKNGYIFPLYENDGFELTEEGIQFKNIPANVAYLSITSLVPNRLSTERAASTGTIQYLVNYQVPVKYVNTAEDVTVKYLDENGQTLAPNVTLSGYVGDPFTTEEKDISGYTLKEIQGDRIGTFSDVAQEVVYVYERSDAAPVTVRYEDKEGNELAAPTVMNGKVGLPYTSEAKTINGWYVSQTPTNANGTYSETAQEVVYVYERSDAAPVTVRYEDTEGNELATPTVMNGKVGLPYTSESKAINGWYVSQTPTNANGTYSENAQEVVYVYERSDAAPVTVRYEDTEGNQLSAPTVLNGKVGLPYESEAKAIPGWYVSQMPTNANGIYSETAQEVVYVYERSDAAPVTVKYEDTEGNELAAPTVMNGKVGLPYESEAKAIPGWYVSQTPTNANGNYSETAQEVVYVYERSNAAPVTVKYEDTEGNELATPTVMNGKVGLPYESEAKTIPGWYVSQTPTNANGTYSETAQEVVYVYERSDAAPVTVKYEDKEGNQLSAPTVLSGKIGLPYTSKAKAIPGWYVSQMPTNANGTYSETAQEVVYVYERSDAALIIVRYEDMEGNQLAEPTILSGKVGLSYESNAKEISGWRVSKTPKNAKGTFSDTVQEVIYVYSADKENEPGEDSGEDTPESENKTPKEENGNSSGNNSKQTNTQTKSKNKLPATGEQLTGQRIMGFLGVITVLFSFVVILRRKRKTEN
ncbi:MucBP domain-containing protein [Enterococcus casseliflavus]|uniref:MucBP domain-containing protein n=1 Tax=Enterococcus casseliflavus TaxID=37734 RepID=UPI00232BAF38|nr:MucBP domain-containing protein [Enterococcus casseliflavus]MDB1691383.1 MucBP domain-containing protein [Enterococcus casseliflavus]